MLQFALGHLDKAAALFKEALYDNPDDWTSLQQYLGCILSKRNASGDGQAGEQTNMYELSVQDQLQVLGCSACCSLLLAELNVMGGMTACIMPA